MDLTMFDEEQQIVPKTEILVVDFINRKLIGYKTVNNFQVTDKNDQTQLWDWVKESQKIYTSHWKAVKQVQESPKVKQKQAVGKSG